MYVSSAGTYVSSVGTKLLQGRKLFYYTIRQQFKHYVSETLPIKEFKKLFKFLKKFLYSHTLTKEVYVNDFSWLLYVLFVV